MDALEGASLFPERRGWGAFGAFALSGELPRERILAGLETQIADVQESAHLSPARKEAEAARLRAEWTEAARDIYQDLQPWETVFVARHPRRPLIRDYINVFIKDFCELHGDRVFGDDPAMVTGLGNVGPHRVLLVGHNRGRSMNERIACNFGCAHPEGYRKALAKMQFAAKFGLPIVTLIDTPGAYPGTGAEERGVAKAIADNLRAMPRLKVPLVSVVIGEGGSGGALGIGVADRLAMMEHSIFSVISPEGCAAILWKTSSQATAAAAALKMRACDLRAQGLVDEILPEPLGGAHRDHLQAARTLELFLLRVLDELVALKREELLEQRYDRLRTMGSSFQEVRRARSTA